MGTDAVLLLSDGSTHTLKRTHQVFTFPLSAAVVGAADAEVAGALLISNPGQVAAHLRVGQQNLDGVPLARRGSLREQAKDLAMAPAYPLLRLYCLNTGGLGTVLAALRFQVAPTGQVYAPLALFQQHGDDQP